ncbi:MAG: bifunctional homocysteine S-methyltransferase/methylenetetrahydrofolate reductase [Clostridiales bacterium]|nr:bifunctional homocysteine S-methyltransferase/methylenetetrahydrofolate reductase [Clostridiales bacterium]
MPDIRSLLTAGPLLMDGAFGTYFQQITGRDAVCAELANLDDPAAVTAIHREYLEAGARVVRANTFAAHPHHPAMAQSAVNESLRVGFTLAADAAARYDAFAAASIGPLSSHTSDSLELTPEQQSDALLRMLDTLYAAGARHFVFETWSAPELPAIGSAYLRRLDPSVFILCQFTVLPDGNTRQGIGLHDLWTAMNALPCDAIGFNCGSGPAHLMTLMEGLPRPFARPVSALPNAGYPHVEGGRMQYSAGADYFGEAALRMRALDIRLPGGCCGTTPRHIAAMARALEEPIPRKKRIPATARRPAPQTPDSRAATPLRKPVAVELEPPQDGRVAGVLEAAARLRDAGVSLITLPDSPLGRSRMSSLMLAGLVVREVGIPAMAHLACRDRNLIALRADLLGAWACGVRNVLMVTGDPVAAGSRDEIREVFNTHSYGLLALADTLNQTVFRDDPLELAAACNPHAARLPAEGRRMQRKAESGARTFFSQPVFDAEAIARLKELGLPEGCRIFAGLMPAVSRRNALFLQNEVPGITVPDALTELFTPGMDRQQAEEVSVAYTADIGEKALAVADGLYIITPFNRIGLIEKIIARLRAAQAKEAKP